MGFNCLKARATPRRQFTFYHKMLGLTLVYKYELIAAMPPLMVRLNVISKSEFVKFNAFHVLLAKR